MCSFFFNLLNCFPYYSTFPVSFEDEQFEVVPLTPEKILELIEQAYPNPIAPEDLAK